MTRVFSTVTLRSPLVDKTPRGIVQSVWTWLFGPPPHPDAALLPVIDAIADTLRVQLASARAQLPTTLQARLALLAAEFDQAVEQEVPDLPALLGIDAAINALYPPAIAARREWLIRERFARVAARGAIDDWWQAPNDAAGDTLHTRPSSTDTTDGVRELAEARMTLAAGWAEARQARSDFEAASQAATAADAALAKAQAENPQVPATIDTLTKARDAANDELKAARDARAAALELVKFAQLYAVAAEAITELEGQATQLAAAEVTLDAAETALAANASDAALQQERDKARDTVEAVRVKLHELRRSAAAAAQRAGLDIATFGRRAPSSADTQSLISYIHNNYIMSIAREKAERDLTAWLSRSFWTGIGVGCLAIGGMCVAVSWHFPEWRDDVIPVGVALLVIAGLGRVGALISISRRLQGVVADNVLAQDAVHELAGLRAGKPGVAIALLSGSIFAVLLYLLFVSGIPSQIGFGTGIFPTLAADRRTADASLRADADVGFAVRAADEARAALAKLDRDDPTRGAAERAVRDTDAAATSALNRAKPPAPLNGTAPFPLHDGPLLWLAHTLGLADIGDLFKLLLWAFVAGFAERFVPDALDRIVGLATARKSAAKRGP